MPSPRVCLVAAAAAVLVSSGSGVVPAIAQPATGDIQIEVVSTRPEFVTNDDALVEVTAPSGLAVTLNGADVTAAFASQGDGTYVGLVDGLVDGANELHATASGKSADLTVTNHPIGGPLFAGPQVQPWVCGTVAAGLGPATDAQCNAPSTLRFVYKSTVSNTFLPYDPSSPPPPAEIAQTTTNESKTVPFIVRVERGTADRGIYDIAVLFDPSALPDAVPDAWNDRLVVPFGGGAAPHHTQDLPPDVVSGSANFLGDVALARGYMVAASSLNVLGQNANQVVSAEALLMLKEHIAETYGPIRFTIGSGGSGGAIQQQMLAASYPGLLDGIQPIVSYTDLWTTSQEVVVCHLLTNYFTNTSPALWSDPGQRAAVDGHRTGGNACAAWDATFASVSDPDRAANCNLPANLVYNAQTNPTGVRCTVQDYQVAIWGQREQDGFAKVPISTAGVQYGLNALNAGQITPEQFADLNAKIGGKSIDWEFTPTRIQADPGAPETAYRTGQVTDARQLAGVPIIDLRVYLETNDIHTSFHSDKMRVRLDRDNGNHDNQIIWRFAAPTPEIFGQSLELMDTWLAGIEADTSAKTQAEKVVANKPAAAVDACWIGGQQSTDATQCAQTYPHYGDARIAAGGPLTDDVLECRLKPLDRATYTATFTDDQWAQMQAAFPQGVCDWTQPSVGYQPSIPWITYADGPGGEPVGSLINPVTPVRIADTRDGTGVTKTRLKPTDPPLRISIDGTHGVPAGAGGVALNVTAAAPAAAGYLTVYPCTDPAPNASNVNYVANEIAAPNAVVVGLSVDGDFCVKTFAETDVVVDLTGWFVGNRGFASITPQRVGDTRDGTGTTQAKLQPGQVLTIDVTESAAVPDFGVAAAALNVTAANTEANGYLTVYPCDDSVPYASNVNYVANQAGAPNAVITGLSDAGTVCVSTYATTDVIVDVAGYFIKGAKFAGTEPTRVGDTRDGLGGVPKQALQPGQVLEVQVAGRDGVPATGATTVALNVTAANTTADGYLTVFPCGVPVPYASNVNYVAGEAGAPNAVVVGLGAAGKVCVSTYATTDVIVDATGWFAG